MQGALLLDIVIRERAPVLKLLACENQALLIGRNALLVLDLRFHVVDRVRRLNLQRDRLASERLHEDLHTATETKNEVESRLLLNVIVGKSTAVLKLLSSEDKALLVGRNTLLVLNLRLHVVDSIRGLDLQRNGLAGECLNEDLHTATETKDKMEGGLLLDIIVGKGAAVFELLSSEDKTLLVRRDAIGDHQTMASQWRMVAHLPLFVLNLRLYVVDGIRRLHLQRDSLAGESLNEDLHAAAETKDEMKGGFLLDIVVRESTAVFKLLSSEDETLLVRRNALLVLNLRLDIINGVR